MAASGAGILLTFFILRSYYRERIVSSFLVFLVTFYGTRRTEWLSASLIFEGKNSVRDLYYSKTSLIRTPLNRNSANGRLLTRDGCRALILVQYE